MLTHDRAARAGRAAAAGRGRGARRGRRAADLTAAASAAASATCSRSTRALGAALGDAGLELGQPLEQGRPARAPRPSARLERAAGRRGGAAAGHPARAGARDRGSELRRVLRRSRGGRAARPRRARRSSTSGSSKNISREEPEAVFPEWLAAVRAAPDPLVRDAKVVVRPYPGGGAWRRWRPESADFTVERGQEARARRPGPRAGRRRRGRRAEHERRARSGDRRPAGRHVPRRRAARPARRAPSISEYLLERNGGFVIDSPRPRRARRATSARVLARRARPAAPTCVRRELRPSSGARPARLAGRGGRDPGARRTVRIGVVHGRKYYLRNITSALDALAERGHELVFAMSERKAFTRTASPRRSETMPASRRPSTPPVGTTGSSGVQRLIRALRDAARYEAPRAARTLTPTVRGPIGSSRRRSSARDSPLTRRAARAERRPGRPRRIRRRPRRSRPADPAERADASRSSARSSSTSRSGSPASTSATTRRASCGPPRRAASRSD